MGKCPKCGKEWMSYSLITGKLEPCGHSVYTKKQRKKNRELLCGLNRIVRTET